MTRRRKPVVQTLVTAAKNLFARKVEALRDLSSPDEKAVLRIMRRRARLARYRNRNAAYPYSSKRQARYSVALQHASHKPGTVQPRHIFGELNSLTRVTEAA